MHNFIEEIVKDRRSELAVYGLGTTGRLFLDLAVRYRLPVSMCIVGNGMKGDSAYKEIPIYSVEEAAIEPGGILVYTVKQQKEFVLARVFEQQFDQVIDISSTETYIRLLGIFYRHYFEDKKSEILFGDNGFIDFKGLKLIDVFPVCEQREAFLTEIGDLILPGILDDYCRIDEGAYEYGSVCLEKEDVVIDCGANMGLFSALAAYKEASVFAFEPDDTCLGLLRRQAELYKDRILIQPAALGRESGSCTFYKDNKLTGGGVYREGDRMGDVTMISLDEFVYDLNLGHVDFIKADIEGSERDMLLGARETLRNFAPKLSVCTYHHKEDPQVLERIILDANPNYHIIHKWKKLFAYADR